MRYKVLDLKSHDPSQPPAPMEGKYSHMECDAVRETQPTISEACSFEGQPGAGWPTAPRKAGDGPRIAL
jgi:hypothetical protein